MAWRQVFRGSVLERAPDPGLQLVTADALALTRAAWSAITIDVNAVLICRASQGMPAQLGISYSWPRRGSFCELVVEHKRSLEIADVTHDLRGTADIRRRHGVVSYLGVPIRLGTEVVGSLCVHDTRPRRYDVEALERLATLASARLDTLAKASRPRMQLLDMAVEPAFAQIRNTATPLHAELSNAQALISALDVSEDLGVHPSASIGEVHAALDGIKGTVRQLLDQFTALQLLLQSRSRPDVGDIVRAAATLSAHHTGLVGGVRWHVPQPDRTILSPAPTSVGVVSATLSLMAQGLHANKRNSGIIASVNDAEASVTFAIQSALERQLLEAYSSQLQMLVEGEAVDVACSDDSLVISLPAS